VSGDANNGNITWVERRSYSLEDDLNYSRSDRASIKGIDYDELIAQYLRCTNQTVEIPANLANIAGHTTDAKAFVDNIRYYNLPVVAGNTHITLTSAGNLKHADVVNITGVPINDGYDAGNLEATFVCILNDGYASEMVVLAGVYEGWRIYGRTRAGAGVSPNSVEIEFRAVQLGYPLSTSVAYTWEADQGTEIHVIIGYRTGLDSLSDTVFRRLLINGIVYGGQGGVSLPDATEIGQFLYSVDGVSFTPQIPVVNDQGFILVNAQGRVVVAG
jgi:hypothetical protein